MRTDIQQGPPKQDGVRQGQWQQVQDLHDQLQRHTEWNLDPSSLVQTFLGSCVEQPRAPQYRPKHEELIVLNYNFQRLQLTTQSKTTIAHLKAEFPNQTRCIQETFKCYPDDSAAVDFGGFVQFTFKLTEHALLAALEQMDRQDGSKEGWIDKELMSAVITEVLGAQYTKGEINQILQQLPTDSEHRVQYCLFTQQWMRFDDEMRKFVSRYEDKHVIQGCHPIPNNSHPIPSPPVMWVDGESQREQWVSQEWAATTHDQPEHI